MGMDALSIYLHISLDSQVAMPHPFACSSFGCPVVPFPGDWQIGLRRITISVIPASTAMNPG